MLSIYLIKTIRQTGNFGHITQVQLFPFYGDIPTYGDIPINRYTIGAKHAYFVGFSSTSQNRKE